jgi:hypothetical protein
MAKSLAEYLGVTDPRPEPLTPRETFEAYDNLSAVEFCQKVLASVEFRQFIMNGLTLGELPAVVITHLMHYAWGKPVERVEHTGKNGQPIETIAEVRRVIVHVRPQLEEQEEEAAPKPPVTH